MAHHGARGIRWSEAATRSHSLLVLRLGIWSNSTQIQKTVWETKLQACSKMDCFFFSADFDTVVHDFCFAVVDDCWIDTCPYMSSIHHPLIWQCACGQSISSESGVLGGASSGLTFVTRSAPEVWGTQNLCCWILWVKTLVHRRTSK